MESIFYITIFVGIIAVFYCFFKKPENLEIDENNLSSSNMNSTNSTIISTNKTLEEAELDSFKNPIKWNCVNQCKNTTDPSLKRVCIDVCLNKKLIEKKPVSN